MRTLRTRLTWIFIAATALPLAATLWTSSILLDQSLSYSSTNVLDSMSRSLESAGQKYYASERDALNAEAASGRLKPLMVAAGAFDADEQEFWSSGEATRFVRSGDLLKLLERRPAGIAVYAKHLRLNLSQLSDQYRTARSLVTASRSRDLRRGFNTTLVLLALAIWVCSFAVLSYVAGRVSKPIRELTRGLSDLAGGNFGTRLDRPQTGAYRDDEIGRATQAFNNTAAHLEQSRDRLVNLTQLASWQVLAKKTAHEVKNSLTPIRLTVEEMVARADSGGSQRAFLEQAAQIVVDEIESLERRVRAFSEFSSEPPVCPEPLDINFVVEDRIAFLRSSHPEIEYAVRLAERTPTALADEDLVKSILLNLLENAAEAAGAGGRVLASIQAADDRVVVEVHDSGPGLSDLARKSLFQPTISFKKRGMGLGLSIARKCALLTGGDILLVAGELGGAGFRVVLPAIRSNSAST